MESLQNNFVIGITSSDKRIVITVRLSQFQDKILAEISMICSVFYLPSKSSPVNFLCHFGNYTNNAFC